MTQPIPTGIGNSQPVDWQRLKTEEISRLAHPLFSDAMAGTEGNAERPDPEELRNTNASEASSSEPLREAFQNFVGQTLFSQMIASMRSTQKESAYFHGGQAERIFQGQLDQILSEEMTKASASQISDPMFRLFQLQRSQ